MWTCQRKDGRESSVRRAVKKGCSGSVYKPPQMEAIGTGRAVVPRGASQWRLQRMTEVKRRAGGGWRIKRHTDLPGPFELDDLMSILIYMDLFLRMVAPVLDDDE